MIPVFWDPPQKPPPRIFPPRVQNLAIFGTPPGPPFFEVLAHDPLGHDPCPPTLRCSLILRFDLTEDDLQSLASSMMIMFINYIYKHA